MSDDGICSRCKQLESYGCSCTAYELQSFWEDKATSQAAEIERLREALQTYQHLFCEGDCVSDDRMTNPECSGCLARAVLNKKED